MVLQLSLFAQMAGQHIPYIQYLDDPWVDSVMNTLSTREQIAQLIWVTSEADQDPARIVVLDRLIREEGIGGVVFSHVDTQEDLNAVSYFRSRGSIPLATGLIGWKGSEHAAAGLMGRKGSEHAAIGLKGRYGSEPAAGIMGDFPDPVTLASVTDDLLLHKAGSQLAMRLTSLGFQVLLTPEKEEGMTGAGWMAGVDIAEAFRDHHLLLASSYKPGPAPGVLEKEFVSMPGFREVLAADEAGTAGLAFCFAPYENEVEQAISGIEALVNQGVVDARIITRRVRMMLAFKYWADLNGREETASPQTREEFGRSTDTEWKAMLRELYASSLTVINNSREVIPIRNLERQKIATLAVHTRSMTPFQRMAANYTRMDHYQWTPGAQSPESILEQLQEYDLVLAGFYPGVYAPEEMEQIQAVVQGLDSTRNENKRLISVFFAGVDQLTTCLPAVQESDGLVLAYRHNIYTEELASQLIFGGIGARGRLPVAAGTRYPAGSGIRTPGNLRLQFAFPENTGISSTRLYAAIDSVVYAGLKAGAYPGCEVMAARKGMVIFHQTYGYHTYDRRIAVRNGDLYDLASVTKVSGPLAGLMVLEGKGQFSHTGVLGTYCPEMKRSDKSTLLLREILAHQAGLYPWIPYWQDAVRKNGKYKRRFLRYTADPKHPLTVADHLYLKHNFNRRIYKTIRKSQLGEPTYLYSGLAFFLFPGIIEDLSGERYEDFLYRHIYHRIGAWDLVFNPTRFYPPQRIVPTEYDSLFRKQQVHGYVHDEGAAMMGGYSGNAGLFATAGDLLKLMEMYRRMGAYGGEQIISDEVLQQYITYQFPEMKNRRGLGFDKPLLDERDGTPADYPCPGASPSSFGHSGFTGTFVWVDPETEITYVFLSNRVYPTRENNLLSEMDIRTSILQSIYDAIDAGN